MKHSDNDESSDASTTFDSDPSALRVPVLVEENGLGDEGVMSSALALDALGGLVPEVKPVPRSRVWFASLLVLSPNGRAFFWLSAGLHVGLKLLLGMNAAVQDQYGFHSLMAPPQSFVLAAGDIGVCFLVAKLVDYVVPVARRRAIDTGLLWLLVPFLTANFIVHTYFKAFVNRGLLAFNGASKAELLDYALAGSTRYSVCFLALALTSAIVGSIFYSRFVRSSFVAKSYLPTAVLALNLIPMAYISQLSQGQLGFMARNPGYELLKSYLTLDWGVTSRATPDEARRFVDPNAAIFGKYESALDMTGIRRPRTNVLFVLIESLPFEQTPLGGAKGGLTVLNELASDAVTFTNFRTVFPATSRSFLTYNCGIYPNADLSSATRYMPGYHCESVVDELKAGGYRTGFFTASMFTYDNMRKSAIVGGYDRFEDFLTLQGGAKNGALDAPAVEEEAVADALLSFVTADRKHPFFATYFMFWDHAPYRLPFEDISQLPPLERYHRTLEYLDQVLRDTLARMKREGLLDDTIVIVAADHGEGFGLHHDNFNHEGHIFEDDVHIPFLVHIPGIGRHTTARQGSNVDFAPTLTALLGLPARPSWQGQDLLSATFVSRPTLLFGRAAFNTNGLIDGNYKYIEYRNGASTALYDLSQDPFEQQNLSESRSKEAGYYQSLIHTWLPVVEQRSWAVAGN